MNELLNIVDVREGNQEQEKLRNCAFMLRLQMKNFQQDLLIFEVKLSDTFIGERRRA